MYCRTRIRTCKHSMQALAFRSPQNQLRLDDFVFCLEVAQHAWLTKVGFAVCLVCITIHVHGTVRVVSAPLVKVRT